MTGRHCEIHSTVASGDERKPGTALEHGNRCDRSGCSLTIIAYSVPSPHMTTAKKAQIARPGRDGRSRA